MVTGSTPWGSVGAAGTDQRTADLTSIVQEIVSRPGWNSGNAMAFIITGSDSTKRVAEAYDGDAAGAPLLYVEYSTDASAVGPVITLNGQNPMTLNVGDTFVDPGATATDNIDGDLTSSIQTVSNVNTSVAGTYTVTYSVTDSDGNSASVSRSVVVNNIVVDPNALNVPGDYPTIAAALSNATDGDTILIAPGTYDISATLFIDKNNITIASRYLTTGDPSYIDSTVIRGTPSTRMIDGVLGLSANLKIIGLTLRDGDKGVTFTDNYGEVHHSKFYNMVRDSVSFDNDAGGTVTYCRMENSGDDSIDVDTRHDNSLLFAYNEFINSQDDGIEIRLYAHSGTMMHYEIHDNLFSGAREDGLQLIDYADDSDRTFDIYRNIFVDNTDVGIGTMAADTAENFQGAAMTERVRIYNNYFYNNSYHITGGDNMIVLNNIFEGASNTAVHRIKTDSIVDYNLFYNNGTNISDTLTGSHNLFTNPQRNSDFTLQAGSPAIDAGTASYTHNSETVLQLSSSEYVGQAPDMGRYEYGSTGSAPIITLLGDNPLYLNVGDTFSDPGATASDSEDGDLTASIQSSSNVNTSAVGSYSVNYSVTDSDGNSATAVRSVVVQDGSVQTFTLERRVASSGQSSRRTGASP